MSLHFNPSGESAYMQNFWRNGIQESLIMVEHILDIIFDKWTLEMNLKLLEDRIIPYSYQTSLDIIAKGLFEVTQNRD